MITILRYTLGTGGTVVEMVLLDESAWWQESTMSRIIAFSIYQMVKYTMFALMQNHIPFARQKSLVHFPDQMRVLSNLLEVTVKMKGVIIMFFRAKDLTLKIIQLMQEWYPFNPWRM